MEGPSELDGGPKGTNESDVAIRRGNLRLNSSDGAYRSRESFHELVGMNSDRGLT